MTESPTRDVVEELNRQISQTLDSVADLRVTVRDQAAQIERLRSELKKARSSLAAFARHAAIFDHDCYQHGAWRPWRDDEDVSDLDVRLTVGDFRRARAALSSIAMLASAPSPTGTEAADAG